MTTLDPLTAFPTNTTVGVSTHNDVLEKAISFRPFGITIAFWSIIIGSIGNLLTILTYVANKKVRTTFNLFLVNLAAIDFWTATGMLPFNLAGYLQMKWPFPESPFTARLQAFQYFCCGYSSVVFLVAITVNRFIGVMFPEKYVVMYTRKRTICVLVICNTMAPILLSPFLFGTDERCKNPSKALTGFHPIQFLCTFICLPADSGWNLHMQFTRVLFQFVPLIAMIVMYSIILTSVKKKRNAISVRLGIKKTNSSAANSNSFLKNSNSRKKSLQVQRRQQEDNRMVLISVLICVAFMVTFLPSVIINLLPNRRMLDVRWHMAASNLTWFNSSINPIIYVFLNRRFRREYWRIIKFIFGSSKGRFIHDSSSAHSTARRRSGQRANSSAGISNSESEAAKNAIAVEPEN